MKVTLNFPDQLLLRAQACAAKCGCTLDAVLVEALTEKLASIDVAQPADVQDGRQALASRLQRLPDGSYFNPDGIEDEEFFRNLERIRSGHWD